MSIELGVRIDGTKETLKLLKEFEPELRKRFAENANTIAKPITDAAKQRYPDSFVLLSGMQRAWHTGKGRRLVFPYSQSAAAKGVKVSIRTTKSTRSVISVVQMNPAASIIDMAGKKNATKKGTIFNDRLSTVFGGPSRVMWPAATSHVNQVSTEMAKLVHEAEVQVSAKLAAYG